MIVYKYGVWYSPRFQVSTEGDLEASPTEIGRTTVILSGREIRFVLLGLLLCTSIFYPLYPFPSLKETDLTSHNSVFKSFLCARFHVSAFIIHHLLASSINPVTECPYVTHKSNWCSARLSTTQDCSVKMSKFRNPLAVQGLGLCTFTAGPRFNPWSEN